MVDDGANDIYKGMRAARARPGANNAVLSEPLASGDSRTGGDYSTAYSNYLEFLSEMKQVYITACDKCVTDNTVDAEAKEKLWAPGE